MNTRKSSSGSEQRPPQFTADAQPKLNGEDTASVSPTPPDAEQAKKPAPKVGLAKAPLLPNPDTLKPEPNVVKIADRRAYHVQHRYDIPSRSIKSWW